jgi:hypothetical protein
MMIAWASMPMVRNFAVRWTSGPFSTRVRDEHGVLRKVEIEYVPGKPFHTRYY